MLNVANRHPGILANMAATLHAVSGGRLLVGLGDLPHTLRRRAGSTADHTQAFHPQLDELVRIARDEHEKSGRDASRRLLVTVFAGLEERWLQTDSRARQSLERVGVDRLILLVGPPFAIDAIHRSGRRRG